MIRDILSVLGGVIWLIVRFMLIIAMGVGAFYCLWTLFVVPMVWEGLEHLAIAAGCVLGIVLLIQAGRDRDEGGLTEDDYRT